MLHTTWVLSKQRKKSESNLSTTLQHWSEKIPSRLLSYWCATVIAEHLTGGKPWCLQICLPLKFSLSAQISLNFVTDNPSSEKPFSFRYPQRRNLSLKKVWRRSIHPTVKVLFAEIKCKLWSTRGYREIDKFTSLCKQTFTINSPSSFKRSLHKHSAIIKLELITGS